MNLENLNRKELLKLKEDIELQIDFIDKLKSESQSSKDKVLSDLKKDDKIFCIVFYDSTIHNMDYVKINFYKKEGNENWLNFSTEHDTLPMGCSSSIKNDYMDKHYFLSDFSSQWRFFTLKPENWKIDVKLAFDDIISSKREYFNKDVKKLKNNIKNLIKNNVNLRLDLKIKN